MNTITGTHRNRHMPQTYNYKLELPHAKMPEQKQIPVWDAMIMEDQKRYIKEEQWRNQEKRRRMEALDRYNSQQISNKQHKRV